MPSLAPIVPSPGHALMRKQLIRMCEGGYSVYSDKRVYTAFTVYQDVWTVYTFGDRFACYTRSVYDLLWGGLGICTMYCNAYHNEI